MEIEIVAAILGSNVFSVVVTWFLSRKERDSSVKVNEIASLQAALLSQQNRMTEYERRLDEQSDTILNLRKRIAILIWKASQDNCSLDPREIEKELLLYAEHTDS